jgi:hypothetical protein
MRATVSWVVLWIVLLVSIFKPFGLEVADWNDPITSTDLCLYVLAVIAIICIEVRNAANYVVEQIKGSK